MSLQLEVLGQIYDYTEVKDKEGEIVARHVRIRLEGGAELHALIAAGEVHENRKVLLEFSGHDEEGAK